EQAAGGGEAGAAGGTDDEDFHEYLLKCWNWPPRSAASRVAAPRRGWPPWGRPFGWPLAPSVLAPLLHNNARNNDFHDHSSRTLGHSTGLRHSGHMTPDTLDRF